MNHPAEWGDGGYNEIQNPRRKCSLIAHDRLRSLLGFPTYEDLVAAHAEWVGQSLKDRDRQRESIWTESIAVGSREFTESTKRQLGIRAKGRKVFDTRGAFELREPRAGYVADSDLENGDIGLQNTHSWNANVEISR